MALCKHCSAPLAGNSNHCGYCGSYVDVDLHSSFADNSSVGESHRICPHCDIALETINLIDDGSLAIERCTDCFGLFFDPGEVEAALAQGTSNVSGVNRTLLDRVLEGRYQQRPVKYIKCPECRQTMSRHRYAYRTGVIIDSCAEHGVWLDNGELRQLLEWTKAGGAGLNQAQLERSEEAKTERKANAGFSALDKAEPSRWGEPVGIPTRAVAMKESIISLVKLFS